MKRILKTATLGTTMLTALAITDPASADNVRVDNDINAEALQNKANEAKRKTIDELIAFEAQKRDAYVSLQAKLAIFEATLPVEGRTVLGQLLDNTDVVIKSLPDTFDVAILVFDKPEQRHPPE